MDFQKSRRLLSAARVARLATQRPDGAIDLVPITFALLDDDTIVTAVDHKPKRTPRLQRLENIRRNPNVTVLVDRYDEDWSALWWVRARGTAEVVHDPSPRLLTALVAKYDQYRLHVPVGPAIVIRLSDVTGWSATGDY